MSIIGGGEHFDIVGWTIMILQKNPLQVLFPPAYCPAGWEVLETLYGRAAYVLGVLVEPEGEDRRVIWKDPNRVHAEIGEPIEPVFYFKNTRCTIAADDLNAVVEWFERYRMIADVHYCSVRMPAGAHFIIWLRDGQVIDPALGWDRRLDQYEIEGVWGVVKIP